MRDLSRLRAAATAVRDDLGLSGRWAWTGNLTAGGPRLSTVTGGGKVVLDSGNRHVHVTYTPEYDDVGTSVVDDDCVPVDCPCTPFASATYSDRVQDVEARTHAKDSPTLRFPIPHGKPGWNQMAAAHEIPIFQVCPDAVTETDDRVYRADIVGLRSPVAAFMAAADAQTVLDLLDAADQLARVKAALAAHHASVPLDLDAHPDLRTLLYGPDPVGTASDVLDRVWTTSPHTRPPVDDRHHTRSPSQ